MKDSILTMTVIVQMDNPRQTTASTSKFKRQKWVRRLKTLGEELIWP